MTPHSDAVERTLGETSRMTEQRQQTPNPPEVTPLVPSEPRSSASDDDKGPLASLIDALLSPLRWVSTKVKSALESLGKRLRSLIEGGIGGFGGGFGFWWIATTVLVAGFVGLLVAILVSPVAGILAFLIVGIGALLAGGESDEDADPATSAA
jgi:hypothetical protein